MQRSKYICNVYCCSILEKSKFVIYPVTSLWNNEDFLFIAVSSSPYVKYQIRDFTV